MTITEFCDGYNKMVSDKLKSTYVKDNLKVKQYVPFEDKVNLVDRITQITMHEYNKDGTPTGNIRVDSISRYMLFTLNLIDKYTNLKVDFNNSFAEYDQLASNGLLKEIVGAIPENEVSDFQTLLNMKVDDTITNELSTHAFISGQVTRVVTLLTTAFKPALDRLTDELDNLDEDKIDKLGKLLDRFVR
jgi:hypothetical protein